MPDENIEGKDPFESVEVFRAGDYKEKGVYTEDDLDAVAAEYNEGNHEAPITIDHKQSGPAFGWVDSLKRVGDLLCAKLTPHPDFAEQIKQGAFKKRSIELHREPLSFRAVTFLGASSPAVKGMANIFSEEQPSGVVAFATEFDDKETLTFDTPMEDAVEFQATKREKGIDFPPRAFLFVPDAESPSTWKLRVWEDLEKKVTRRQLGLAAAAFSPSGFRGNRVVLPRAQVRTIKRRLRALYRGIGVADAQIPAQVRNFAVSYDVNGEVCEFFEESFAIVPRFDCSDLWLFRLYEKPEDDKPNEKLVGQAISCFSPGGFGVDNWRIKVDAPYYLEAKHRIANACALIDKDPSWATITEDDIFWSEEFSVDNLRKHRPDIIDTLTTSFKEENQPSKQEEVEMTEQLSELNDKIEKFEQDIKDLNTQAEENKTALDEKTVECSEKTEELEALKKEQAIVKNAEAIETAIDEAKLSEHGANEIRAIFKDAENTEGLQERIDGMKKVEEQFATGKDGVDDNEGNSEYATNDEALAATAAQLAKDDGIPFAEALKRAARKG